MYFSIIIPVYNVEKFIRESIDSVIKQDEEDIEIILVDDGSTDSSGKICDEYKSNYPDKIRVIHKENEGLLLTRRRGIKEAKGRWLIHLDSDDYMMPGVLKYIREKIEKYNPDLIIGKIAYGAKDGRSIAFYSKISFYDGQTFDYSNKDKLYKHFFLDGYINAMYQKIARNDIVDINADYSKWKRVSMAEDVLQSLPILYNSKNCVYIDKVLVYYRYNTESITRKRNITSYIKNIYSLLDVISEERKYLSLMCIPDEMISDIATKYLRQLCDEVKQMCKLDKERKAKKQFICELGENESWKWLYINANQKTLGRFSKLCYYLVSRQLIDLLCLLCRAF